MNISQVKKYYHLIKKKIEPAKFIYSPLGKAFGKQIKTVEDQGKKQIDCLKDLKPKEQTKSIEDKYDDNLLTQENFFNSLLDKRMDESRY